MGNAAWFWDRMARRYARTPVPNEEAYQRKLTVSREFFAPGARVLEFGCGTGSTAIAHAPHVAHILGIDSSARMIAIARDKAAREGLDNVAFQVADITRFDAGDEHYDAVLGLNILHLLDDWRGAIRRVGQLLKPRGVFISSTACLATGPASFRAIAAAVRWLPLLPVVRVIGEEELVAAMEAAGLVIEHRWQPGEREAVFIVARRAPDKAA